MTNWLPQMLGPNPIKDDKCPRQAQGAAVTAERNPDNVRPALEMFSGHLSAL